MSSLDYAISVLEEAGGRISYTLQATGVNQVHRVNQLAGITEAIILLRAEIGRRKEEEDEIEKIKEKEKDEMKLSGKNFVEYE